MTRERAIHELSRLEYDVVSLLMLTTKFDNTRWPWRRAVATSVVGVAAEIERDSKHLKNKVRRLFIAASPRPPRDAARLRGVLCDHHC